jgi:multiple antibiotic resistance protein
MLPFFIKAFFAIFGVMDPVGNVPAYLTLTDKMDQKAKWELAKRAVARAGVILIVFLFLGNALLDAFHISIESFRIAGGLVLVLVGLQILFGLDAHKSPEAPGEEQDVSIVPLATPLIAGPGTITTTVILSKEYGYIPTLLAILANLALTLLLFRYAYIPLRILGKKGAVVFAKVMGLILVAIGVEFIRSAI